MAALFTSMYRHISAFTNKRYKLTTWRHSAWRSIDELSRRANSSTARLPVSLDFRLNDCGSGQRMILCVLTDMFTCHYLTIEIRWDPGGLTDISSSCQTAYNLNTRLAIQSITLVIKQWHVCQSLHVNKYSGTSVHESPCSRTIRFTNKYSDQKRLGWRTVSRIMNTQAGNRGKLRVSALECQLLVN
jgi:hypothetical protein